MDAHLKSNVTVRTNLTSLHSSLARVKLSDYDGYCDDLNSLSIDDLKKDTEVLVKSYSIIAGIIVNLIELQVFPLSLAIITQGLFHQYVELAISDKREIVSRIFTEEGRSNIIVYPSDDILELITVGRRERGYANSNTMTCQGVANKMRNCIIRLLALHKIIGRMILKSLGQDIEISYRSLPKTT
jgi:hypothetical protein